MIYLHLYPASLANDLGSEMFAIALSSGTDHVTIA